MFVDNSGRAGGPGVLRAGGRGREEVRERGGGELPLRSAAQRRLHGARHSARRQRPR